MNGSHKFCLACAAKSRNERQRRRKRQEAEAVAIDSAKAELRKGKAERQERFLRPDTFAAVWGAIETLEATIRRQGIRLGYVERKIGGTLVSE